MRMGASPAVPLITACICIEGFKPSSHCPQAEGATRILPPADACHPCRRPSRMLEGSPHPDPIVESSSLAGVKTPPPTHAHTLRSLVEARLLSGPQLETVVYANMRFQQRLEDGGASAMHALHDDVRCI